MRSARRSSWRMLTVVSVAALLAAPAPTEAADDQPQIGFVSGESQTSTDPNPVDVYVAGADGTDLRNLTVGDGGEWEWAWSPDGSRVVFFSDDIGTAKLYMRALAEVEPVVVAESAEPEDGWAWSPDSTRIAFVSLQDGDTDVYVADVETNVIVNVSNDSRGSSRPRWSPTGSHIAYDVFWEDNAGVHQDVFIVPATGGDAVNVTDNPAVSGGGAWSPDGSRFVFVTDRDGNNEIYTTGGDGRNPVRLTNDPANDRDPAWSPDGSTIAFSSGLNVWSDTTASWQPATPWRVYLMDTDGANRRVITDESINPYAITADHRTTHDRPTWSPDGSKLTVTATATADEGGISYPSFEIHVIDPAGGPPVHVWGGSGPWSLVWSPNGEFIAIDVSGTVSNGAVSALVPSAGGAGVGLSMGDGSAYAGWSTYGTHFAFMGGGPMLQHNTVTVTTSDGRDPFDIGAILDGPVNSAAAWRPQPLGPAGLVDPSAGVWYLRDEWGVIDSFYYGNPGDVPFMGDWNGDGIETPGLYRQSDGYVYLRNSNTQGIADIKFYFGNPSDVPLAGDFNGDGFDTVSIYRPSEQRCYIINELGENDGGLGAADYDFVFGDPGDQPVVGDWDGDGVDEIGLHRASTGFFYYRTTLTTGIADAELYFGNPGDRLVAGDWGTIDGRDTPAVFRPSNTVFYFRHTLTQGTADSQFTWPEAKPNWIPVAGTYTE